MNMLMVNLTSVVCAASACCLAFNGVEGWGWFLCGALVCHTVKSTTKTKEAKP